MNRRSDSAASVERLEDRRLLAATVGVYDENVVNANTVDFVATGSSFTNTQFAADVAAAYQQNAGGVIDASVLGAYYDFGASANKTLRLFPVNGTNFGVGAGPSISKGHSFASTSEGGFNFTSFSFNVTTLGVGGTPLNEYVTDFGVTVMSRSTLNGIRDYGVVTVNGRLASGAMVSASRPIAETQGNGDTFYGLAAPNGEYFTGFSLSYSGAVSTQVDTRLWFDDIGFITSAYVPPAPSVPALTLSISPNGIDESGGAGAATGTVTRDGNLSQALVVSLASSDTTEATVPATVTIAAGQASATFAINAVNDAIIDGDQTVTITASVVDSVGGPLTLDSTFGSSGVATTSLRMNLQPPQAAVAVQADGKVVAASEDPHTGSWRITRLNADGSLDTTFGTGGVTTTQFAAGAIYPVPLKIVIQADGKILVGGRRNAVTAQGDLPTLVRYNANGTIDTTFGTSGVASIGVLHTEVSDIALRADGNILVSLAENGAASFRAARLTSSGQLDTTFGSGGIRTYSINAAAQSISLTSDGGFILAGWETIARFDAAGNLIGSPRTIDFGTLGDVVESAVLSDGKIVVGFYLSGGAGGTADFAVARLNADGTLDTTFSGDGWNRTDFFGLADIPASMVVQSDGKIILGGYSEVSSGVNDVALVRYGTNGELDATFDGDGRYTGSLIAHNAERFFDIALYGSGQLVALGGWHTDYRVARYDLPGIASTASATVTIADDDMNSPPVANDLVVTIDEDGVVDTTLPATDAEGDSLTFAKVTNPTNGSAFVLADGRVRYFPRSNFFGTDSFTYSVTDGTETVTATVRITVRSVNDAPYTGPQGFTTAEDVAVSNQLQAIEVENDPMTFTLETGPAHGSVIVNADGTFTYTPDPDFSGIYIVDSSTPTLIYGSDQFTFRVTDDKGAFRIGTAIVNVTPVDDAPVAANDTLNVSEDGSLTITMTPVNRLVMRSEPGDWIGQGLSYDISDAIANFDGRMVGETGARIWITGTGISWDLNFAAPFAAFPDFTYLTPGEYLDAVRLFAFQSQDRPGLDVSGMGRGSNTLTGEFVVFDVDYNVQFGGELSDIDSFAARFEQHSEGDVPALHGTIQYNTTFGVHGGVLSNDSDGDGDFLRTILVSGPSNGTLTLGADGSVIYTPNANFSGTDSFTYRVTDGVLTSELATVTINVEAMPDPPVFTQTSYGFTTPENTVFGTAIGAVGAVDPDSDAVRYSILSGNESGAFTIDAVTGVITVADASKLDFEMTPVYSLVVRATEQTTASLFADAAVTVTLTDVAAPQVTEVQYGLFESARWIAASELADRTAGWKIDRISITFDLNVSVGLGSLSVFGNLRGSYAVSAFDYDEATRTAVWTLAVPVDLDRLTITLDGDNASDGVEGISHGGEYLAGGDAAMSLDVLFGDVDGDGYVNLIDALLQRGRNSTADIWSDTNGDGTVNLLDALLLRGRNGTTIW